ncbi:MAG: ArnT family glycosyltransferase [Candidatus Hodarchaeales archaeon]
MEPKSKTPASSNLKDLLGRSRPQWENVDSFILIIAAFAFLTLSIPFWVNPEFKQGVDEGILVMQGKMIAEGYSLYDEVYSNQAPLGLLIFALLGGDFIATRLSSLLAGTAGLIGVGLLGRELAGRRGMIISMLLVGLDKMFLRQSHMASIIMFSVVLTIWAVYFFIIYVNNVHNERYLVLSGLLLGLATLFKLFAGITAGLAFFGLIVLLRSQRLKWVTSRIGLFCIAGLLPLFLIILFLDPTLMVQRTILDQTNQPRTWTDIIPNFDMIKDYFDQEFTLFVFFALIGMGVTYKSKTGLVILGWLSGQLVFFAVYWLLWPQHLLYLAIPLALEATVGLLFLWDLARSLSDKNSIKPDATRVLEIAIILSVAFSSFVYFDNYTTEVTAPRKPVIEVADRVKELTVEGEIILSGDPRVTVLADRLTPPWLTDVARYRPKSLDSSDLIRACEDYEIRVVILAYWLLEQDDFRNYIMEDYSLDSSYLEDEGSALDRFEIWTKNGI